MMERWPQQTPLFVELSMLAAAGGTVLLLLDVVLPVRVLGAAVLGLAAGIPFAYAFTRAQQIRRDAPAFATGFVNGCASVTILVGAPLVGFTFGLPGEGAIGVALVAALWAAAALSLRGGRTADPLASAP